MTIDNKYTLGETVFLRTDEEQLPRIVTAICVRGNNYITYELSMGIETIWHVEEEIDYEENDYYKNRALFI